MRILLVDDDSDVAESIRWVLETRATIDVAHAADQALQMLRDSRAYDVLVCDLRLGPDDGLEVVRACRGLHPTTRRILLTGHAPDALSGLGVRPDDADQVLEKDRLVGLSADLQALFVSASDPEPGFFADDVAALARWVLEPHAGPVNADEAALLETALPEQRVVPQP